MSEGFVLATLLVGLFVSPLGCELVVGDVSHHFAGAGGTSPGAAGEAGETNGGAPGAGASQGGKGGAGAPGDAGAGGAGESTSGGVAGESGAAGAPNGCTPVNDGNPCTDDLCVNGVPANPPSASGTACSSGGILCDGAGTCVACLSPTDCPGTENACQARSCTNGACGHIFATAGTLLATQTAGDCKQARCDGAGAVMQVVDDADVPNDSNACTSDVCSAGSPSNPPKAVGTSCGTNLLCNSAAVCVGCNTAADCPGTDNECKARTCISNQCGVTFTSAGTAVAAQTAGDCLKATCDGAGNISNVADSADLPADDGNACTDETCAQGVPQHPAKTNGAACSDGNACTAGDSCQSGSCSSGAAVVCTALDQCHTAGTCDGTTGQCSNPLKTAGAACSQNGGSVCSATGACVPCLLPADCPGTDSECHARTCTNNQCGVSNVNAGTPTSAQTTGDCHQNQCDGSGNLGSAVDDTDVPADDGNQCTFDTCSAGTPVHPPRAPNTTCNQGGGSFCDAAGTCVACNVAAQCPGTDGECHSRSCSAGTCGVNNVTPGTTCSEGGGHVCDGSGACSDPAVTGTSPASGSTPVASPAISVTFNVPMDPATLLGQTVAGACSGTVQVSLDDFTTCVAFATAGAAMSASNTQASFSAAPGLLVNRSYKIRVTTAALSAGGFPLLSAYTQANAFTTTTPDLCNGSIVISQVYGGGGGADPSYGSDFVELHNRGSQAVNLSGWAVQYADAASSSWQTTNLPGISLQPGAFLLVAESAAGSSGTFGTLPTPDVSGAIALAQSSGKVALTNTTAPLSGSCASGPALVDFVGYGAADCFAGAAASPAPSLTSSAFRAQAGCANVNDNGSDFMNSAPTPHNSTVISRCGCGVENEASSAALEANYCAMHAPLGFTVAPGASTPTVSAQLYELGITDASASASPLVRAQLGYGPTTANPEYEQSWQWSNATFNASCSGCGNNHEYLASFSAPSALGNYDYAYRFSLDQGVTWTYCDADGAGSNVGLQFDLQDETVMTVQ